MYIVKILTAFKSLFLRVYDLGVIPNYAMPIYIIKKLKIRAIFMNKKIKENRSGYYYIDPMPSIQDLNFYYENTYWQSRGKEEGVNQRDFDHFMLIRQLAPDFFEKKLTFLNFGAGHGGISHLFFHAGHKVINIEPSGLMIDYNNSNWQTYKNINDVSDKVDCIYGCHSLEHVQDISSLQKLFLGILNLNGLMFWEVPNGSVESNGGCNGKLVVPHTYYFTTKYFDSLPFKVILNQAYDIGPFPNIPSSEGQVIRYLGNRIS
jgi:hypothetical protein